MTRTEHRVGKQAGYLYVSVLALLLLSFGLAATVHARPEAESSRAGARSRGQSPRTQVQRLQRRDDPAGGQTARSEGGRDRDRGSLSDRGRPREQDRDRDADRFGTFGDRLHFRSLQGIGRIEHRPLTPLITSRPRVIERSRFYRTPIRRGGDSRFIVVLGSEDRYYSSVRYYGSALYSTDGLLFWYEYPSVLYRDSYRVGHPFGRDVHWWRGHEAPRSGVTVVLKF